MAGVPGPLRMPRPHLIARLLTPLAALVALLALAGCGSSPRPSAAAPTTTASSSATSTTTTTTSTTTTSTPALPGSGRPPVTIGDKNYTEQFLLGQLYYQALQAQGFTVSLNQNIGPDQVRLQQLHSGLFLYPEFLNVWNSQIAGQKRSYTPLNAAYTAAQNFAFRHGLELLDPTPFSDTAGIAVTDVYAQQ